MTQESSDIPSTSELEISDSGNFAKAMEVFGEHAPKLIPSTIKKIDMCLSTGVESIFYLLLGDRAQIWNLERRLAAKSNALKLLKRYEGIEEEDITKAPMELTIPIIEQLSYTEDENLSDILISLLTAASSKSKAHLIHPSLVNIAQNLAPDEALILKAYYDIAHSESLPMIEVLHEQRSKDKSQRYTSIEAKFYSFLSNTPELRYAENIDLYTGNMISLGLFLCRENFVVIGNDPSSYEIHPDYKVLETKARTKYTTDNENTTISIKKLLLQPTEKGKLFIEALNSVSN